MSHDNVMALPPLPFEIHDLIVDALVYEEAWSNPKDVMNRGMVNKRWLNRVRHALFLKRTADIRIWIQGEFGFVDSRTIVDVFLKNPECALKEYVRRLSIEENHISLGQFFPDQIASGIQNLETLLHPYLRLLSNVTRLRLSEFNVGDGIQRLPSVAPIENSITLLELSSLVFATVVDIHSLIARFPNVKTLKIDHIEILSPTVGLPSAFEHRRPEIGWELQYLDLGYQEPPHFDAFLKSLTLFPCNVSVLTLMTCIPVDVIASLLKHLGPTLLELSLRVEECPGNGIDLTGSVPFPLSLKHNTRLKVLKLEAFNLTEVKSVKETLWVSQLLRTVTSSCFQSLHFSYMSPLELIHLFNWDALKEVLEAEYFPTTPLVYVNVEMMDFKPSELRPRLTYLQSSFEANTVGKVAWLKPTFYCQGLYALFE